MHKMIVHIRGHYKNRQVKSSQIWKVDRFLAVAELVHWLDSAETTA